jgi:hypothetical protein
MFDSASGYERSFDEWMPYGIPDAVQSDAGFDGFVKGPLEAHNQEVRMAGDQIGNFMAASNAHRNAETDKQIAEMMKPEEKSSGGGIGGTIGSVLGSVAGNVIAPGIGGGIGSKIGGSLGGLFG